MSSRAAARYWPSLKNLDMNFFSTIKQYLAGQTLWTLLAFFIILLAGLFAFNDYGASWDENIMQVYADQSLKNYGEWRNRGEVKLEHETLQYYGPFFMMTVQVASRFLGKFSDANPADLRHLVYFLAYFASVVAFYTIARRWFDPLSSMGASLLYALQPVLWGHAFINPKDAPFMALMTISVAAGLKMTDALRAIPDSSLLANKRRVWVVSIAWLVSMLALFLLTEQVHGLIVSLVNSAKAGETNIVSLIASKLNQVPAKVYIERYFVLFLRVRAVYTALSFAVLLYFWYRKQPILFKILTIVLAPALLLGFTASTRVLGPYAGIVVAFFALYHSQSATRKPEDRPLSLVVFSLCLYALLAMSAAYLTWPFLWADPPGNFIAALQKMSEFPWAGRVLFDGQYYAAPDTPMTYLPVLLLIQMTEPVWILVLIGSFLALFGARKKTDLFVLFALWFLLPVIALIARNVNIFDNFRHVLFILPPVFLMAGGVFERIVKPGWRLAAIALCLAPGLIGILSLHPYEYAYYNQFIGGMRGAQGRFETEYWLTSYRAAAEYINENAPPNAAIWVEGPGHVLTPFARADLIVNSWSSFQPVDGYEYVVASSRFLNNETAQPGAATVYEIKRGDATLTVIRKP